MIAADDHPPFGARELALAMLVNLCFALNVIAMKVVVTATAPFFAVAARMGVVFLLCLPWFRRVPGRNLALAAYGAVNGGLFLLVLNLALNMAHNVGALAIAGQLSVPFSLLLGALLFGERLRPVRLAGVLLAFAGVALLAFDPHMVDDLDALAVMSLAAFLWAAGTLIQRRLPGVEVLNGQAWNGLLGFLLLAPFAAALEPGAFAALPHLSGEAIGWFAFSCLGGTIAGQGALAWLLQRHAIPTVMPLVLASPVVASLAASFYFHTPLTVNVVAGGLIAMAGVGLITLTGPGGRGRAAKPAAVAEAGS